MDKKFLKSLLAIEQARLKAMSSRGGNITIWIINEGTEAVISEIKKQIKEVPNG